MTIAHDVQTDHALDLMQDASAAWDEVDRLRAALATAEANETKMAARIVTVVTQASQERDAARRTEHELNVRLQLGRDAARQTRDVYDAQLHSLRTSLASAQIDRDLAQRKLIITVAQLALGLATAVQERRAVHATLSATLAATEAQLSSTRDALAAASERVNDLGRQIVADRDAARVAAVDAARRADDALAAAELRAGALRRQIVALTAERDAARAQTVDDARQHAADMAALEATAARELKAARADADGLLSL